LRGIKRALAGSSYTSGFDEQQITVALRSQRMYLGERAH
jgi:hypothetical protein